MMCTTTTLAVYNAIMCCYWRNHHPVEYVCSECCYTNVLSTIKLSIFIFSFIYGVFFGLKVFFCFIICTLHIIDGCSDFEVVASFEFILLCKVMSYVHKYIQDIISFFVIIWGKFIHFHSFFFTPYKINKNHLRKESFCITCEFDNLCTEIFRIIYFQFFSSSRFYLKMSWTYMAKFSLTLIYIHLCSKHLYSP